MDLIEKHDELGKQMKRLQKQQDKLLEALFVPSRLPARRKVTMGIPFTQHLLPHDDQRPITIDMPTDIENKAQALLEQGFRFDIEMLPTGMVYMVCYLTTDEHIYTNQLCENGPPVVKAVTDLVNTAHERLVAGWLEGG